MLPSKGYFKSLNCPYFLNGFCNRPHCHFRHTRKDKAEDENQQLEDLGQAARTATSLSDVVDETSSDNPWPPAQQSSSSSFSYKPTPIVELKKRHIPINTAPSVNLSSTYQKRRIEYDIKGLKKPKVKYVPEAINNESHSSSVYPTNVNNTVYRATKICGDPHQVLNGSGSHGNPSLQDTEESEGEIDFDQVSNELNFLDEILKEYEKPISIKSLLKESSLNDIDASGVEQEQTKSKSELFSENFGNGFSKDCPIIVEKNDKKSSSESDHISNETKKRKSSSESDHISNETKKRKSSSESDHNSNKTKKIKDCDKKSKSEISDSKSKTGNETSCNAEKSKRKRSTSNSLPGVKDESTSSSEHRRKSVDHHKSEGEKNKKKEKCNDSSSSSKTAKKESGSESSFDKLLKSDPNKSSNHVKLVKKDSSSGSSSSSKKESDHKSSSSKSSRKDSERESKSNKSSTKDSERKSSSSKSHKKESDNQSKSSKSKTEPKSSSKRTHSPEGHSSSKKLKSNSNNADHKHDDKTKSSKYKDENRHRKESNEKRKSKEEKSSNSKEYRTKEKSEKGNKEKNRQIHSVSESDSSDVEIISETGSIIVIDSEEDSSLEKSSFNRKTMEKESPNSWNHSSGTTSPIFPTDLSPDCSPSLNVSDDEDNEAVNNNLTGNDTSKSTKIQDDASLLDHRVQSNIKNRVSLGTVSRPPRPPPKKPIGLVTPTERLLLFARLREKEREERERESGTEEHTGKIKIGVCPRVQHILAEKKRILEVSDKNPNSAIKPSIESKIKEKIEVPIEDKDVVPTVPRASKHPRSKGADLFTRKPMLEKLYKYQKQLLKPGMMFKTMRDKCLDEESNIWLSTNYDQYEGAMLKLIAQVKSKISDFTLCYFTQIKTSFEANFPSELRKKSENGTCNSYPDFEESFYSHLLKYCLTEAQLEEEGYPRKKQAEKKGDYSSRDTVVAYISQSSLDRWKKTKGIPPTGELACYNCSKFYAVDENGLSLRRFECKYHAKKSWCTLKDKTGQLERKARCCGNDANNPCMTSEYHSTETRDLQNLEGFVETKEPVGEMPEEGWGIFAMDCEMYWSTRGSELGRVTVINADQRTVYDTFVRPEFPVTDYSTRMSGLTAENLANAKKTFSQVQDDLMKIFNAKTILIGHSLENDLKSLQIVHHQVVDTAMVYKKNEFKQALKVLASEHLKEVIQNEEDGHDSAEDAVTCIKLMAQKVRKDALALSRKAPPALRGRWKHSS